jgi:predicted porin
MKVRMAVPSLVALLCCGSAKAQASATLYGVVDAGIDFANHQVGGGSVVRQSSANVAGSRWGLRGAEDLGGGLKAVFVLESGFDADTGKSGQGGRLFGRMAYVGMQGQWGSVLVGRQQNEMFDLIGAFDPMQIAPKWSILNQDLVFASRADNTVKYVGTFGGLTASAMYSFGAESNTTNGSEVPGNSKLGREYGFRVSYSSGPFSVGSAYDEINTGTVTTNPDAKTRRAVLTGTYDFSAIKLFAGYRWARAYDGAVLPGALPGPANQGSNLWWTGAIWQAGRALTLSAAAYYQDYRNTGGDPWLFVVMGKYAFSKRTDAYLSFGYAMNRENSNMGLGNGAAGFGNTPAGSNQFGGAIGIRHVF